MDVARLSSSNYPMIPIQEEKMPLAFLLSFFLLFRELNKSFYQEKWMYWIFSVECWIVANVLNWFTHNYNNVTILKS